MARGGADVAVRINRPLRLTIPDLEAAVQPGVSALFITKTESVQHLRLLDEVVSDLEKERGLKVGSIGFGAMIEHPRALSQIHDIAEHAPRLIGMMLGGEDFALETGSIPGDETLEFPKRLVAFAAQAHDVPMIGILGTVADYSDPEAYRKSAERARRFGFSGGTCIHPGLVAALNAAFTPSAEDVAHAQKLIQADAQAAAEGRGSFQVDGKMIDIPVIERARKLIARANAIRRRVQRKSKLQETGWPLRRTRDIKVPSPMRIVRSRWGGRPGTWGMRHFIVGALLVLAALAVTSMTATLLERAALNRQSGERPTAIVEGPGQPAGKAAPGKSGHQSELEREVSLVSRRLVSGSKD